MEMISHYDAIAEKLQAEDRMDANPDFAPHVFSNFDSNIVDSLTTKGMLFRIYDFTQKVLPGFLSYGVR